MLGDIQERAWAVLGGMRELRRLWQGGQRQLQRLQGLRLEVDEVTLSGGPDHAKPLSSKVPDGRYLTRLSHERMAGAGPIRLWPG